jgi:hypothetical protein
MADQIRRLATKFRQQEEFAAGYSPLYAALFGAIASWLEDPNSAADPLVNWLVDASRQRHLLDISLLLAAAICDETSWSPGFEPIGRPWHSAPDRQPHGI